MSLQEGYWDRKIEEWTDASYTDKKVGFIEKLASLFRRQISGRLEVALEVVGPLAKGKTVADLGCGLGDFCFDLLAYRPKKVIGIDISGVAVRRAKEITSQKKLARKVQFLQADLGKDKKLPKFDIAVGLGFIDYFNEKEMRHLFKLLDGRYFFFSFFEKKRSLFNLIHHFYVRWQRCPGAYKYTRKEIGRILPKKTEFYFLEKDRMLFITNLPRQ